MGEGHFVFEKISDVARRCIFPFAPSTPHILHCTLPLEMSTQPQPVQAGFLPP